MCGNEGWKLPDGNGNAVRSLTVTHRHAIFYQQSFGQSLAMGAQ